MTKPHQTFRPLVMCVCARVCVLTGETEDIFLLLYYHDDRSKLICIVCTPSPFLCLSTCPALCFLLISVHYYVAYLSVVSSSSCVTSDGGVKYPANRRPRSRKPILPNFVLKLALALSTANRHIMGMRSRQLICSLSHTKLRRKSIKCHF